MRSISSSVTGRPSAASSTPGSLVCTAAGSKPLTTGLIASTARPAARKCRISAAVTKVLPTSVPVAVTKIAVTASTPRRSTAAHDVGKPLDLGVGMLRGEGEAQPRGAGRHGRRPDGDDQKAFLLQQPRGRERRLGFADTSGTIGLSASGSPTQAGEALRLCERQRGIGRARARSGRARRSRPRRSRAAGRSNRRSVRARLRIRSITGARGAEIAAIAADRLRQRAHLQRHIDLRRRARRSSRGRRRPRRCRGRRPTSARRRSAAPSAASAGSGARSPSMENTPSVAISARG